MLERSTENGETLKSLTESGKLRRSRRKIYHADKAMRSGRCDGLISEPGKCGDGLSELVIAQTGLRYIHRMAGRPVHMAGSLRISVVRIKITSEYYSTDQPSVR
jgi:hypothetical protein